MSARRSQREEIMCAALGCFAQHGYHGTRIAHIAEAAGVSDGALYRHFSSKEELARAVYFRALGTFSAELGAAGDKADKAIDSLRKMAACTLDGYRAHPDAFIFALGWIPSAEIQPESDVEPPADVVARVVAKGQSEGSVREGDAHVLAAAFLGCILQPIMFSRSPLKCIPDLLVDDSSDNVLVEAALGATTTR